MKINQWTGPVYEPKTRKYYDSPEAAIKALARISYGFELPIFLTAAHKEPLSQLHKNTFCYTLLDRSIRVDRKDLDDYREKHGRFGEKEGDKSV